MAPDLEGEKRDLESEVEAPRRGPGLMKLVRGWMRAAFVENAAIKFVSLVLAVTLFILVNTGQDVTIWLDVGLSYTMPEDKVLVSEPVDSVKVGIRGSWRRTRRFDERELERIRVDLRNRGDGIYEFQPHMFRLPQGLELVSITPSNMRLEFEPLASKSVPVRAEVVGEPAPGYRVAGRDTTPRNVTVRGAKSAVDAVEQVETLAVSLSGHTETFEETVPLAIPQAVEIEGAKHAKVRIELVEELERKTIEGVPVSIRSTQAGVPVDGRFTVEPAQVDVVLLGPQAAIEKAMQEPLFPYVSIDPAESGGRKAPVLLGVSGVGHEIQPAEVTVVKTKPSPPE